MAQPPKQRGAVLRHTPPSVWIPALVFAAALIVFLMVAFFLAPTMTPDQRGIVLFFFALAAGFSTHFLGGTALLELSGETAKGLKLGLTATAGIAVFIFCLVYPPYFFRHRDDKPVISLNEFRRVAGNDAKEIFQLSYGTERVAAGHSLMVEIGGDESFSSPLLIDPAPLIDPGLPGPVTIGIDRGKPRHGFVRLVLIPGQDRAQRLAQSNTVRF